ncbi:MAG: type II secretion system F family protein [archaeon]
MEKTEDEARIKKPSDLQIVLGRVTDTKHKVMYFSGVLAIALLFIDFYINGFDVPTSVQYLPFVFGIGAAPHLFYQYYDYKRTKAIEDKFPDFLRSLAEAQKSGITLIDAILQARDVDYGALSPEIQKMSAQLSWGVPFPKVIRMFEDRMSRSDFIKHTVTVVMEAFESGGDIAEAMSSVASNAVLVKDLEADRQNKLAQQVLVMYVIFFIFLGMVIVLQKILGPLFAMNLSAGGGGLFGSGGGTSSQFGPSYYRKMFFSMVIIQAVFNGLLAGQLGEGRVVAGIKHAAIMLLIGVAIFMVALPPQALLLDINESETQTRPAAFYTLQGSAFFADGTPVLGGRVIIVIDGVRYETTTQQSGQIEYKLKVPALPGKYKVDVTLEPGGSNKPLTKTISVLVSR